MNELFPQAHEAADEPTTSPVEFEGQVPCARLGASYSSSFRYMRGMVLNGQRRCLSAYF